MVSQDNKEKEEVRWYVMRDLKRTNARQPAYKLLEGLKMEIFVPMRWSLKTRKGIHVREEVPFIQDLLFVHETQSNLDTVVGKTPTLQYRWLRNTWREPMTVADKDMRRFIKAVRSTEFPQYYLPEEVTPGNVQTQNPYRRRHARRIRGPPADHPWLQGQTSARRTERFPCRGSGSQSRIYQATIK